jgi:hypothetical protein
MKISFLILTALMMGAVGVTIAFAQENQPVKFLNLLQSWNQELVQEQDDAQLGGWYHPQLQSAPLITSATAQEMNKFQLQIQNQTRFENQNQAQIQIQNKIQTLSMQLAGQAGEDTGDQVRTRLQLKTQDRIQDQSCLQEKVQLYIRQPLGKYGR